MKKLTAIIIGLMATILALPATALAVSNKLLPDMFQDYKVDMSVDKSEALETYNSLERLSYQEIAIAVVKTILFLAGSLVVIGLLVVGAMYLTGATNEENVNNAKKVLGYIGIGILVITASYAIATGILQINLFS